MKKETKSKANDSKKQPILDIMIEGNHYLSGFVKDYFDEARETFSDAIWACVKQFDRDMDVDLTNFIQTLNIRVSIENGYKPYGRWQICAEVEVWNSDFGAIFRWNKILQTHNDEKLHEYLTYNENTDFEDNLEFDVADYESIITEKLDETNCFDIAEPLVNTVGEYYTDYIEGTEDE